VCQDMQPAMPRFALLGKRETFLVPWEEDKDGLLFSPVRMTIDGDGHMTCMDKHELQRVLMPGSECTPWRIHNLADIGVPGPECLLIMCTLCRHGLPLFVSISDNIASLSAMVTIHSYGY